MVPQKKQSSHQVTSGLSRFPAQKGFPSRNRRERLANSVQESKACLANGNKNVKQIGDLQGWSKVKINLPSMRSTSKGV